MAIRLEDELINFAAANANYPEGSMVDESAAGLNDGSELKKIWPNDIYGFLQAALQAADIAPSGNADNASSKVSSQYLSSVLHQVLSGGTFADSGAADAYVLSAVGNNIAPANYSPNMNIIFVPGNTNTGASTVNLEGLGLKGIRLNGVALVGGELVAGIRATLIYDDVNGWFELLFETGKLVQALVFKTGAVATGTTQIPDDDTIPINTEGDQYMSLAITPKNAANKLIILSLGNLAHSASSGHITAALFQDAIVNAIAVGFEGKNATSNAKCAVPVFHEMTAGGVGSITFNYRAGTSVGGTTTFNGASGARLYGGALNSYIMILEVQP